MGRKRATDTDRTVRRTIDVAAAFAEQDDPPTSPAVRVLVPLDAVPILALGRSDLPWGDLDELSAQLLLRVDGKTRAMHLVTGNARPPGECARELAALARRGLLRLLPPATEGPDSLPLEIDLTML